MEASASFPIKHQRMERARVFRGISQGKERFIILHDIEKRPPWELSCYGLNLSWESGRNIIGGDFSPEELRLEAYAQQMLHGNITGYLESVARAKAERSIIIKRILEQPEEAGKHAAQPLYPVPGKPVL